MRDDTLHHVQTSAGTYCAKELLGDWPESDGNGIRSNGTRRNDCRVMQSLEAFLHTVCSAASGLLASLSEEPDDD
jgi:hypothetical protein